MKVRVLATEGKGQFTETIYECPETIEDGLVVKNIMTGVCTSDIAMMQGEFGPLPLHMQGHEGLGQVVNIGTGVFDKDIQVGDYVATRGEPAYADYYPVREGEYVRVPAAEPKYIIEPVACGINVILGELTDIQNKSAVDGAKLLIIGSGFLAYVAYQTLKLENIDIEIDVVGRSNDDVWYKAGVDLKAQPDSDYDIVVNLRDQHIWLERSDIIRANGLLIDAVGRPISKKESENLLWKAVTTVRPSPRKASFYDCMIQAVEWIENGNLQVDDFWTEGYNRDTNWKDAFADGANRPKFYSRGYIYWNK